ncbi:MAG: hypothetical protein K6E70_09500 [Butyrivibrio sp.]|nr:hypothetical protein [Butyrivibrio sp.]
MDYNKAKADWETFDYLLSYAHSFIENPGEIPQERKQRFEDMKLVVAEYDKIQERRKPR